MKTAPLLLVVLLTALTACSQAHGDAVAGGGTAHAVSDLRLPGKPVVGEPFSFRMQGIDGSVVDTADLQGKVVVIDFWATWCGPCVRELPGLVELYEEHHDQGLEVVGLSFDRDPGALSAFVDERDIPWPQVYLGTDADTIGRVCGVTSIPRVFVLDRDGTLHTSRGIGKLEELLPRLL